MSERYPGGIISKNAPVPTTSSAPGVWTLEQQAAYQKAGTWPFGGPFNFIEDVFSTYLYTGNGSTQTITNGIDLSGKGGLVWQKTRNQAFNHALYDTARGTSGGFGLGLISNSTSAQVTGSGNYLTTFNSNGFTASANGSTSGDNWVSWTFREQAKFFDVVTWTGNGANPRAIPHSLGSVPGCIIIKDTLSASDWYVYHRSLATSYYLKLNTTDAQINNTTGKPWNTTPTSTEFYVGGSLGQNITGETYVAYLFAHNAGGFGLSGTDNVISCGSYTGNGSVTGPSITLGYEPQWVMVKSSTVAGSHWYLMDTMRGMAQTVCNELYANLTAAEITQSKTIIPTATGFDVATTDGYINNNGSTYIYIAIRRGPMKTPTTGTSVFAPIARTGTGATATVTTNFATDLIISHARNAVYSTGVWDRLRGVTKYLETTGTAAEATSSDSVTLLPNTEYVLGSDSATDRINRSGDTYANWAFGRAPGFFDVVCYSGSGSTQNISHNLAVVPELIIFKARNSAQSWPVYSATLGTGERVFLNGNGAAGSTTLWPSAPTSSVFSVVGGDVLVNANTVNYVAYLFASCPGVSKVGSYTGTGTTKQINCGFTGGARFVMIRRTATSGGDWYIWDSARGIVAGNDPYLLLNSTAAEVTSTDYVDTFASGFEISSTAPAAINASGGSYIFLAIA